jgi:hypothetical protein
MWAYTTVATTGRVRHQGGVRMRPSRIIAGDVRQEEGLGCASRSRNVLHQAGEWLARIDGPRARGLSALRE